MNSNWFFLILFISAATVVLNKVRFSKLQLHLNPNLNSKTLSFSTKVFIQDFDRSMFKTGLKSHIEKN